MTYLLVKAFHLISMVAWFAGLFYLPRLFVYHTQPHGTAAAKMLVTMERKLYRYIMTPAMLATWGFGLWLIMLEPGWMQGQGWLHAKLLLVLLLTAFHAGLGVMCRKFARGENRHSEKFYRLWNEIPTLLLFAIVLLAVLKPF